MKRIRNTVIAIGLIIATMGLTSCSVLEKTDKAKGKQIVAKVGDTVIKRSQIDEALKDYEATLIENYGEDYLEDDTAKSYYESARQSKLDELVYNELVQMYIKDNNIEVEESSSIGTIIYVAIDNKYAGKQRCSQGSQKTRKTIRGEVTNNWNTTVQLSSCSRRSLGWEQRHS